MKRIIKKLHVTGVTLSCLLLSAFCLLPSTSLAQEAKPKKSEKQKPEISLIENKKIFTSVSFGPTVDWFAPTTNELTRNKAKGGFIAGINVDVSVIPQKYLYISTGVLCRYLQGDLAFNHKYRILSSDTILHAVRTYQTMYLTIPTGIKFRTPPSKNCIFTGQLGLYHNFKIGGKWFDSFELSEVGTNYFITTGKAKNIDAALFTESGYIGFGFEYEFAPKIRAFANTNYSCQFGYFSSKATNNINGERFKSIVHSLNIVFGISF
jgi:hypothetical protein